MTGSWGQIHISVAGPVVSAGLSVTLGGGAGRGGSLGLAWQGLLHPPPSVSPCFLPPCPKLFSSSMSPCLGASQLGTEASTNCESAFLLRVVDARHCIPATKKVTDTQSPGSLHSHYQGARHCGSTPRLLAALTSETGPCNHLLPPALFLPGFLTHIATTHLPTSGSPPSIQRPEEGSPFPTACGYFAQGHSPMQTVASFSRSPEPFGSR